MPGILAKQDVTDDPKKAAEGNGVTANITFDAALLKGGGKEGEEMLGERVSSEVIDMQRSTTPDSGVCV